MTHVIVSGEKGGSVMYGADDERGKSTVWQWDGTRPAATLLFLVSGKLWKNAPNRRTHFNLQTRHINAQSNMWRNASYTTYSWENWFGGSEKIVLLFFLDFLLFLACHFLSLFLPQPFASLAEFQRGRVHWERKKELEKKGRGNRLLDLVRQAGKRGATISITVPFGNRDTSISNKTANADK